MNRSRLIWGIICLAIAGLLAVLNLRLPADKFIFLIWGENMPWVPIAILGVLGVVLLASAGWGTSTTEGQGGRGEEEPTVDEEKAALNKRLETAAWGLFLVMLGGFAFVRGDRVPNGLWSIGVGLIFLGLNVARYVNNLRMSGFTTFLGIISLVGGVADLFWEKSIEGPLLLIVLGGYLILKPWFEKRQLFGKAEQS